MDSKENMEKKLGADPELSRQILKKKDYKTKEL